LEGETYFFLSEIASVFVINDNASSHKVPTSGFQVDIEIRHQYPESKKRIV